MFSNSSSSLLSLDHFSSPFLFHLIFFREDYLSIFCLLFSPLLAGLFSPLLLFYFTIALLLLSSLLWLLHLHQLSSFFPLLILYSPPLLFVIIVSVPHFTSYKCLSCNLRGSYWLLTLYPTTKQWLAGRKDHFSVTHVLPQLFMINGVFWCC